MLRRDQWNFLLCGYFQIVHVHAGIFCTKLKGTLVHEAETI